MNQLPEFVRGHQLATIQEGYDKDDYAGSHLRADEAEKAHIVISAAPEPGMHRPLLDIDFPAQLIPSSTPGHFHLYMDKPMSWQTYSKLLAALAEAGIIEQGYANVSDARGYTSVRVPWARKGDQ